MLIERTGFVCRLVLLTITLGLSAPAWGRVRMGVVPLFGTTAPPFGCLPLKVRLQNLGPSAEALLTVDASPGFGGERSYLYPVSLPSGSQKEILALPFIQYGAYSLTLTLTGVRPALQSFLSVNALNTARVVVGVGDDIGGLEFLRTLNATPTRSPGKGNWVPPGQGGPEWSWAYCRPEDVPNRAAAFTGVSVVVLGAGAERLTTSQWQALRQWVMMGGALFAPGGASAVYLRHVALADLLPVQNLRTETWSDWSSLSGWLPPNSLLPGEPTYITTGDADPEAIRLASQGEMPLVALRPFGEGYVVFTAFNLWDRPFRGWAGLPAMWKDAVASRLGTGVSNQWSETFATVGSEWHGASNTYYPGGVPPGSPGTPYSSGAPPSLPPGAPPGARPVPPYPYSPPVASQSSTPIRLPSTSTLTFTLLAYLMLVVPGSYLFLKRLRKLDWHWLTAPVLALAFVFIIGSSAAGLYRLGNQNKAQAIVLAASGESNAYMLASTTLFLQRAGDYSVDFANGEAAFANIRPDYTPFAASGASLETVEGPGLRAMLRVPNLAYRQLYWTSPITLPGTIEATAVTHEGKTTVTVTNHLQTTLKNGYLYVPPAGEAPRGWVSLPSGGQYQETIVLGAAPSPQSKAGNAPPVAGGPPGGPGGPTPPPAAPAPQPVAPRPVVVPTVIIVNATVEGLDVAPQLSIASQRRSVVKLKLYCPVQE